ncbi:MAG: AAA family ATPase [Candidatus Baldrarchaeia archaeon]
MITSLEIKNYRAIKSCKIEGLSRVNVFIGRNNSGKSSLLEAIYLASAAFKFEERLHKKDGISDKISYLLNRRGFRGLTWDRDREVLWHMYKCEDPIEVEFVFCDGIKLKTKLFEWHEHPILEVPYRDFDHMCLIHYGAVNSKNKSMMKTSTDLVMRVLDEFVGGRGEKVRRFLSDMEFIDANLMREIEHVEKILWRDLLKYRLDKIIIRMLKSGYDVEAEDITYVPYGEIFQLVVKLPDAIVRVDDLGDGAKVSMMIIMVAALSKNTAVLIEEPENHQHPSGLAKTLEIFLEMVMENRVQAFITTHSLELIKLLNAIAREKNVDVAIFFMERDKAGNVNVRRLTPENVSVLDRMGIDPRFLDII